MVRTAQLRDSGVTRREIARAVSVGALLRLREGVFALPGLPAEVRAAAAHGGMLSCLSAAAAAGLWVVEHDGLHIAVGARDRVHAHADCDCVAHRTRRPVEIGRRSTVRRALIEILRCAGDEAFFATLESALLHGRLSAVDLEHLRRSIPVRHRWMLDFARADADSGLESLLRFRLRADGIELRSQVDIPGVGCVDFVLGDRLILEVDGVQGHADTKHSRHKDLVRDGIAAGLGFDTLRFDYALVVHEWPTVRAAILARVDAGLHRRVAGVRFG
ncbi:hypothetical protein GCM10009747_00570 [Agromyces humatus]|uniref:DUF559 domain-containing protein n=1 Tax=Agromyces humatus TaxID=279573 RepID=A0ABN2K399_9MICO